MAIKNEKQTVKNLVEDLQGYTRLESGKLFQKAINYKAKFQF